MEPWKGEEQSKQNSSRVLSAPIWNLPEQSKVERALGRCSGRWAQASVLMSDPLPYLSEPPSEACRPSHQWSPMDTLSLEKVFSPTTNRATSRRTHVQETGGCPRQLKGAGKPRSDPTSPIPPGWGHAEECFRAPCSMACFTSTWPTLLKTPELLSSR